MQPCNLDQNHQSGGCLNLSKHEHIDPRNGKGDAIQQRKIRGDEECLASKREDTKTRSRKRKRSIRGKQEDVGNSDAS